MAAQEGIIVGIGGNIDPLKQSLKRAGASVSEFASKAGKEGFGSLIAPIAGVAAAVGSVGAIMEGLKGALDLGGEMLDASHKTGIAIDALVAMKRAAKDAGVPFESITGSISKMQKTLAGSVGGGGSSSLLKAMGLDAQTLASEAPDKAFQQIGEAIRKMPNSTEQAAAAMAIFGKKGAELLQIFNDPAFEEMGNISKTAKLLKDNAESFDAASDILGHTGGKLQGFFVGLSSSFVPALLPLLEQFDKMDFSSWGVSLGNIIGNFATNFTDEFTKIGKFMQDIIGLAFSPDGLAAFGEGVLLIGARLKDALIYAFKTPIDYLEAGMQHAVETVMEQVGRIPIIGSKAGLSGFKADSFEETLKQVQARGNGLTNQSKEDSVSAPILANDFNQKASKLADELKKSLLPVVTATAATNKANEAGRKDSAGKYSIPTGSFNAGDIGEGRASIVADSFAKIGGGGRSSFLGVLDVNRQQLQAQHMTNTLLSKIVGSQAPAAALAH